MIGRLVAILVLVAAMSPAWSRDADLIVVTRGANSTVFGSCMPSLTA